MLSKTQGKQTANSPLLGRDCSSPALRAQYTKNAEDEEQVDFLTNVSFSNISTSTYSIMLFTTPLVNSKAGCVQENTR